MIGAHIDGQNIIPELKKLVHAGGNIAQIFLTPPGQTHAMNIPNIKTFAIDNNIKIIVHSSFMHNLCKNWDEYSWWIKNIQQEIQYAHEMSAIGIILHLGKQMDLTEAEALNNMYTSLMYIHNKTKQYSDVKIILETPTGQGTQVCYKLDKFAQFYKKFSCNPNKDLKNRMRICIDTCHIFTSGYDITSKNKIKQYLELFNELIGLKYIMVLHLNDSKVKLGGMVDRHHNIGQGYIGFKPLKYFFDVFVKLGVDVVLETPNNGYMTEIRSLMG